MNNCCLIGNHNVFNHSVFNHPLMSLNELMLYILDIVELIKYFFVNVDVFKVDLEIIDDDDVFSKKKTKK